MRTEYDKSHAAQIYTLMSLRLQHMTKGVANLIEAHGEKADLPNLEWSALINRYAKIADEWLVEPPSDDAHPAIIVALARFAAFVNVDRGFVELIAGQATLAGDELDVHHVGIALSHVIKWLSYQYEQLELETLRAGGTK